MSEPTRESTVTLRTVTDDNLLDVLRLKVSDSQTHFVAPNPVSIAQAHFEQEHAWFRAIYADETPVGFLMMYDDPYKPVYFLWRFMVDERYQGLGFGYQALALLVAHVKTRPCATELKVSYVPGEGSPGEFYRKAGFEETGEVEDGENFMRLTLVYGEGESPAPALGRPLTHVVMVKLKERTPEIVDTAVQMIRSMEGKIEGLKSIEVGKDILHSERSYDLALIARLEDRAALERYNQHPVHLPVLEYLKTVREAVTAVDFE